MIGKSVYLLAFLVSIVAVVNAEDSSHHLVVGVRQPGDRLVSQESVFKNSKFLQTIKIQKIFYAGQYQRITQVKALDQKTNGNGAVASLLSGGPDASEVTLEFKSKRGHSINFIVEIYAK